MADPVVSELYIEQKVCEWARKQGWKAPKLASPENTGFPDRTFLLPKGRVVFIEFKKPGEKPTPKQVWWHNELKKLGQEVYVCDDINDAILKLVAAPVPEEGDGDDADSGCGWPLSGSWPRQD